MSEWERYKLEDMLWRLATDVDNLSASVLALLACTVDDDGTLDAAVYDDARSLARAGLEFLALQWALDEIEDYETNGGEYGWGD